MAYYPLLLKILLPFFYSTSVLLLIQVQASAQDADPIFDDQDQYRVLTPYGLEKEIELDDYLASGVTAADVTFSLKTCDETRSDYYSAVSIENHKLILQSNTLGHIHGASTQTETTCTVTATAGMNTEDKEFEFYMVSASRPPPVIQLTLEEKRSTEADIKVDVPFSNSYVFLSWRKSGGQPTSRVVSGVSRESVLTIPDLESGTEYEVRASAMTRQSFDLWRGGNEGEPLTLITAVTPPSKWRGNLSSDGIGKSASLEFETLVSVPTLSINDVTVAEGTSAVFTVTLSNTSSQQITVQYATSDGTATSPADYTSTNGTLTIAAQTSSVTITVPTVNDTTDESDETFTVTLSSPVNATVSDGLGAGTITDDDGTPTLSINDVTVAEGTSAVFTVTLSNTSSQQITVQYATSDGTATSPADYTSTNGTLTIAAQTSSVTITVPTVNDTTDESDETFTVTLSSPVNATVSDGLGAGTITDDDGTPTLSINDVTVAEGTSAVFTVTLSNTSSQQITVQYATSDGTATSPADYTSTNGTLTIAAQTSSVTITVPTVNDTTDESDERFTVTLSSPVNATVSDGLGAGTITDNDGTPTLSINDVTVAEGTSAVFTVTLSNTSSQQITVQYATSDGTATSPADYTSTNGTLTIAAQTSSVTITVPTVNDTTDESDETFTVTLSSPVNATVSDGLGAGTITDDDGTPTLSINDVTVAEGTSAVFTVTLSNTSSQQITVRYATSDGTATSPADYTSTNGTLTIAAQTSSVTITVPTVNDTTDESDETFTVTLTSPQNATVSDGLGAGTITDNDGVPTLSINDVTVAEGTSAVFTVTLSNTSSQQITVQYATSDGTATSPADYTSTNGTLTIAAQTSSVTITVPTVNDTTDESDETFTATLTSPQNATVSDGLGAGTITDNDGVPTLSINDVTVAEGTSAVFTVTLSNTSSQQITVRYATSDGTATSPADYTSTNGTLTIAAQTSSVTITVPTVNDTTDESDETFTATLTSPQNATVSDGLGAGTITDNDGVPTLSINDVTVAEGTSAVFTVTLSNTSSQQITVRYATSDGTATSPADYTSTNGTLTIAAQTSSVTITVPTVNDTTDESDETFTATLTSPQNATVSDGLGAGTITDNDGVPTLSINDVTVAEGTSAVFTVTLSNTSSQQITVRYATSDGTATSPADYTSTNGTLTIAAQTSSVTITVPTVNDTTDESDETFTATLTSPQNATVSDGLGAGTITDNDGVPTLSINDVTVAEGTSAVFTVTLSNTSSQQITVRYATSDGTATSPADYTSTNGTLTIAAQTSSVTITVPTVNDTTDESDETFTATLTSPQNATVSDGLGAGTITDNDGVPTLSINDVTVAEGTSAVFTVTLSNTSSQQITVRYATSDGTATSPADYTSTNGTLTIAAQTSSVTITVPTVNDTIDESNETFTVTLTSPQNATVSDGLGAGTITDNDDDTPTSGISDIEPTLSINDVTVAEGTSAVFTVTLSNTSSQQITVRYATSDGTATSPADYTSTNGTLTIAAQTSSVTITVPTVNDTIDESNETFTVTLSSPQNATVSDGQGAGTITDNDGNGTPTPSIDAVDDSVNTYANTPVIIHVRNNDQGIEGFPLNVISVTDPPNGKAQINSDNTITYAPDSGYVGVDSFTYTISANGSTDTATVTVSVLPAFIPRINCVNQNVLPVFGRIMIKNSLDALTWRLNNVFSETSTRTGIFRMEQQAQLHEALKKNIFDEREDWSSLDLEETLYGSSLILEAGVMIKKPKKDENMWIDEEDKPLIVERKGQIGFWGKAGYNSFSVGGDGCSTGKGDMASGYLGLDRWLSSDVLTGISLSLSRGTFRYENRVQQQRGRGNYHINILSASPYIGWFISEDAYFWTMFSYGRGDIDVNDYEALDVASNNMNYKSVALGIRSVLFNIGHTVVSLKSEVFRGWVNSQSQDQIMEQLSVDIQQSSIVSA